jgi:hypothetical protein
LVWSTMLSSQSLSQAALPVPTKLGAGVFPPVSGT